MKYVVLLPIGALIPWSLIGYGGRLVAYAHPYSTEPHFAR